MSIPTRGRVLGGEVEVSEGVRCTEMVREEVMGSMVYVVVERKCQAKVGGAR